MGLDDIGYHTISNVIESWELGKQRFGCIEEVGMEILLKLFQLDPSTKTVFGFKEHQDVIGHPMLRMGVLVHSESIIKIIDGVLALLGPDIETLEILLSEQGARHVRMGVKPEHLPLLGDACREALSEIIPEDKWTPDVDASWKELFSELTAEMVKSMT